MQEVAALCDEIVIVAHGRGRRDAAPPDDAARANGRGDPRGRVRAPRSATRGGSNERTRSVTVLPKEVREILRDRRTLVNSLLIGPLFAPLFFARAEAHAHALGRDPGRARAGPVVNAADAPNLVSGSGKTGSRRPARGYGGRGARSRHDVELVVLRPEASASASPREPAPVQLYADSADSRRQARRAHAGAVAGYSARSRTSACRRVG